VKRVTTICRMSTPFRALLIATPAATSCWLLSKIREARIAARWWRTWIAALATISSGSVATAAVTVLDFEDIPAPQPVLITAQYGVRGVLFQVAYLDKDPNAHSGTQVLRSNTFAAEFPSEPLVMTFTSPQSRVHFWASSHLVTANGTLTGFDAAGNVVATDGPRPVTHDVFTTEFQIKVNSPTITRAEYQLDQMTVKSIDDLEFEGKKPPPPPKKPPVVKIMSPPNGADLDVSTIDLAGTVTGAGLISPVNVVIESLQQTGLNDQPLQIALTGSGSTKHFLQSAFGVVPMGPVTVKVTAENSAAMTGTTTSTFMNLPAGIRNRFAAEGGAAMLGTFRFGIFGEGCKIAVYDHAAISVDGAGMTRIIRGAILAKWLTGATLVPGPLGCPLGDEADGPAGTRLQDFQGGRIYANLPAGTVCVPAVFVDAINKRGGDQATGVPLADPTRSSGLDPTHLFQQFTRPDRPDLLPSTLEIRGFPPVLWLERQGGNLSSYPKEFSATLWENFPCSKPNGPCSVDPEPSPPPPISDAGDRFCGGKVYPCEITEWQAILGDYISTPVFGVAVSSKMAGVDNPLTHENIYDCLAKVDCPSDWNVEIFPIGPQRGIAPFTSILAENTYVELEYEEYYFQAAGVVLDWPQVGDLFVAAGRWIIDCGHGDPTIPCPYNPIPSHYRSELHPIFMFAKMKTQNFQGQTATRADIWVNGWYPGDPIEFDLFPPPRPSPNAQLILVKPVDADAARGVSVEFSWEPPGLIIPNSVHVRFSAPLRQNTVNLFGEMFWEPLRGYYGQWFLFWGQ